MLQRNRFDLSHDVNLTMKMGELVPICVVDTLPGDQFQAKSSALIRSAPLNAPVLTPTRVFTHSFYVPNRIIWPEWYDFITGGEDGTSEPEHPVMISPPGGYEEGSLAQYLGIPKGVGNLEHSALPFRAYAYIYNEYFRDQDLEDKLPMGTNSGLDTITNTVLQNVAWEKDYFTLARPWPQRGPTAMLPLSNKAPIRGIGRNVSGGNSNVAQSVIESTGPATSFNPNSSFDGSNFYAKMKAVAAGSAPDIWADLSEAAAVSIRDLRITSAFQRYMEVMALFGARPAEYLRSVFGVKSSDARLDRPEYLAGGIDTIQWSEVLQTAPSTDAPVGALKGHGIAAMRSNRYRYAFEEHGWVITLMSVKPKTLYAQGLHRMWNRRTKEDYFNPFFQHVGMQEIEMREIYAQGTDADLEKFGNIDRYAEYRSQPSRIAGLFTGVEDYWTLARIFETPPALNADFIKANPSPRIFADLVSDHLLLTVHNTIHAIRPIAKRADYKLQ